MRSLPRRRSRFGCTAIQSARASRSLDRFAAIDPGIGEVATLRTIAATVAYLLADRILVDGVARSACACPDVVGAVQRALVPGRAAHQGDWRSDCARRDGAEHRDARAVADGWSRRHWAAARRQPDGRAQCPASGDPCSGSIGSIVRLFDPVAYLASLLCIVTACACAALIPTLRAGRIDPIAALRQD